MALGEGALNGPGCQDAYHSGQRPQHPSTAGGLAQGSDHKITPGPQFKAGQLCIQGTLCWNNVLPLPVPNNH